MRSVSRKSTESDTRASRNHSAMDVPLKFTDTERQAFSNFYTVHSQDSLRDAHCIKLGEASQWIGFTCKQQAVELLGECLIESKDYELLTQESQCATDEYMLNTWGFKKLLIHSQTDESIRALRCIWDIEEALFVLRPQPYRTIDGKTVRNKLLVRSVTGATSTPESCLYFGVPEGSFSGLTPMAPYITPELGNSTRNEWIVIKLGRQDSVSARTGAISNGFYMLDCMPTQHTVDVEYRLRNWLMNEGVFFEGVHEQKTGRDTELLVVASQEQYAGIVKLTQRFIEQISLENEKVSEEQEKMHQALAEIAQERSKTRKEESKARKKEMKARRQESKARKEESRARKEEARARREEEKTAGIKAQVRLAELELQKHARPEVCVCAR